ncbi:aldehyde dehydrogenase [Candidatus Aerophobetes bacterium]|nr:aldehyde dehydrogenase [Candidatus Aerophobetes bacterium]
MQKFKFFINNQWVDSVDGKTYQVVDPSKNEPIAEVALANEKDVDRAVKAAREAFDKGIWSELDGDERAEYMLKVAELMKKRKKELARWETLQTGKPIKESEDIDIPYSIRAMEYFANQAREIKGEVIPIPGKYAFDYVTYEPYGVVGSIVPWNFPLHLATRTLCPAIATGNTVVLKPSSYTPITVILLGEMILEAGFPPGVVNIISGPGDTAGNAILRHPDIDMISFTGSLEVGQKVLEASARPRIKKVVLELGGKGPFIAEPDCDIDGAVNSLITGFCLNQGEVCCASTRLFLHEKIYDEFMEKLVTRVKSLKLGNTMDPSTQMGALINKKQLEKVDSYVKEAIKDGAKLVCGGEKYNVPPFDKGNYYKPTILENVTNNMRCAQEEIFGPVLVVLKYKDLEEAIKLANDTRYGLGATIWSENPRTLYWAAKKLDAGTVWMNTNVMSKIEAPYGGNKDSGLGREDGTIGIKEYLKVKNNILFVGKDYDNFYGFK